MSGIVNKIKEVLHKDSSSTTQGTTQGTTSTHGTANPNSNTSSLTSGSTNHGGHNSNLANKADPRIDSDRDGSRIPGVAGSSGVTGNNHSSLTGNNNSGLTGNTLSSTHTSTNAGPHDSNALNKLDPRVDSDNSKVHGNTHSSGLTGNSNSSGLTGNTHSSNTYGTSHTSGPHSSDTANRADPRVNSDNSHKQGHSVTHGSTNNGPHDSNLANRADPRVDSDLSSTGNRQGANTGGVFGASGSHATSGSGTAQNTSGPHNSDLLNKLDPRVDSDKDGSKTVGGNKTHA